MTTHFAAYLDDQDLIRMEGGESVTAFLPFTLTSGSKTIELLPTEEEKTLRSPLPIDMSQSYTLSNAKGETCLLHYRDIVRQPIFDQLYAYDGEDLGAHYSKEKTTFAFWACLLYTSTSQARMKCASRHHFGVFSLREPPLV